jgi:hypothetical protein
MAMKDEFAGPGWLPIVFDEDPFVGRPKKLAVRIGDNEFRGQERRRRAGKYMDNAFAEWREMWLMQDKKDLGFIDTTRFPPPTWAVGEGDDKREGVVGQIVGVNFVVGKPFSVGVQRKMRVPIKVGERIFTLHRNGELFEGEALVARLRKGPHVIRTDADDVIWGLSLLLLLAGINAMLDANVGWENLLDPTLILEIAFAGWS